MKTRILALASLVLAFGMTACSGADEDGTEEKTDEFCVYSYDESSTEFGWTAFKTSAKVGVGGTFNDIVVESEEDEEPLNVIKSLSFTMNTASTETNDEGRNAKVAKFFFETINTPEITGKVASVNEDTKQAAISVTMNGITIDVNGDYTYEDGKFSWVSSINVSSWNAMSGIEALNEECSDLHTGDDGVSKLWSEVSLSFSTTLSSDCD